MQDLNDKITGGTLTAAEWNEVPSEIQNVIEGLGITLSGGDLNQLGKAIAGYVANGTFYTDSGAVDAYVLTKIGSKQSLTAYTDGATFEFVAGNVNTGASTVNVAGLGVKNIKLRDGTDPAAGQVAGRTLLKFDLGNDWCELIQSGMVAATVISVSGTYNPPAGVKALEFTVVGGGGGAGGVDGQGAGTTAISGPGTGAGTAIKTTPNVESSYTVTIGSGGTGGAAGNNSGSNGGTSSVVSVALNLVANGGNGGSGDLGISGSGTGIKLDGGTSSGGDINLSGDGSSAPTTVSGDAGNLPESGTSFLGGNIPIIGANGINGINPGSGGGGSVVTDLATNFSGGDGKDGVVIIKEFF